MLSEIYRQISDLAKAPDLDLEVPNLAIVDVERIFWDKVVILHGLRRRYDPNGVLRNGQSALAALPLALLICCPCEPLARLAGFAVTVPGKIAAAVRRHAAITRGARAMSL
jgi:hypothetical protein